MVELLLATQIPDPNLADTEGNTPLIYCVSLGMSFAVLLGGRRNTEESFVVRFSVVGPTWLLGSIPAGIY